MNNTYKKVLMPFLLILSGLLQGCGGSSGGSDDLVEVPPGSSWQTSDPASEGMDPEVITDLETALQESGTLYSFIVIRNGKIISETYRNGASQTSLLHLRSVTKHVTGLLAGMAIDQGLIESSEDHIAPYFEDISSSSGWADVTVNHLLNMLSGMDWREDDDLRAYENNLQDPLPYIFAKNIVHPPGTKYEYNSPGTHLVSHLIQRVSGSTKSFAEDHLFDHLGVTGYQWEEDGQEVVRGGAGLELTSRDLAKLGLLYLQDGIWEGMQLVPESWINETLHNPISISEVGGFHRGGTGYRNFWWSDTVAGVEVNYSDGYGGQLLLLAPGYDLIVVANHKYRVEPQSNTSAFGYLFGFLLPMVFESIEE